MSRAKTIRNASIYNILGRCYIIREAAFFFLLSFTFFSSPTADKSRRAAVIHGGRRLPRARRHPIPPPRIFRRLARSTGVRKSTNPRGHGAGVPGETTLRDPRGGTTARAPASSYIRRDRVRAHALARRLATDAALTDAIQY